MRKLFVALFILSLFYYCEKGNKVIREIVIKDIKKINCFFLVNENNDTIIFNRKFKILKNSLTDTIIMGDMVVFPNQTGYLQYSQLNSNENVSLDLDYRNPPTDRLCIYQYKGKNSLGKIIVELETIE